MAKRKTPPRTSSGKFRKSRSGGAARRTGGARRVAAGRGAGRRVKR